MWNWPTDKESRTRSKAEKNWKNYVKVCVRLERVFDYFYLLNFNSFQKGFIGLTTITTMSKYKINQWKKNREREKIIIENPVKFCGGLYTETYSIRSHRVAGAGSFNFTRIWNGRGCKDIEVTKSLPHTVALPQENAWKKLRSLELVQLARAGRVLQPRPGQEGVPETASNWGARRTPGLLVATWKLLGHRGGDWMTWMIFAAPLQTQ